MELPRFKFHRQKDLRSKFHASEAYPPTAISCNGSPHLQINTHHNRPAKMQ